MLHDDERRRAATRLAMASMMREEGARRRLSIETRLSKQTLRSIETSGVISSMHTASVLEDATGGAISVRQHMQPDARGSETYGRPPADAVLQAAVRRRCSTGEVLASIGLTHQDLNLYMHADAGPSASTRTRVEAAIAVLATRETEARS